MRRTGGRLARAAAAAGMAAASTLGLVVVAAPPAAALSCAGYSDSQIPEVYDLVITGRVLEKQPLGLLGVPNSYQPLLRIAVDTVYVGEDVPDEVLVATGPVLAGYSPALEVGAEYVVLARLDEVVAQVSGYVSTDGSGRTERLTVYRSSGVCGEVRPLDAPGALPTGLEPISRDNTAGAGVVAGGLGLALTLGTGTLWASTLRRSRPAG